MTQKTISFKTSWNLGDTILFLSGIKSVCEKENAKADIFIWLDRVAAYYPGASHPIKDITGKKEVSMNHYVFKMLKPLLEAQPFINSVDIWNGEHCSIDLDTIKEINIGQPKGDLRLWPGYRFSDMVCDISLPALSLPEHKIKLKGVKDGRYIVVNRTERYLNNFISYHFLRDYPVVLFVGVPKEYNIFTKEVPNAVYIQPTDFLELAHLINNAVLFAGNQSFCYAVAEQLKVNRVLEVCKEVPNVIPVGPGGYPYIAQNAFEYFVSKLWTGKKP